MQEPPIIPQDTLPNSGALTLQMLSSSTPATDEVLLKQVTHPFISSGTEKQQLADTLIFFIRCKIV